MRSLQQPSVGAGLTRCQFDLNDFATHLHDALLLPEPIVIGNELSEVGILQLPLGANSGLAGNASRNLEHAHESIPPDWTKS